MTKIDEIWLPIVKSNGLYEVSNLGKIRNSKTKRVLKQNPIKGGYLILSLHIDGNGKTLLVHRLVAETFISNPDNKPEVNHLDKDRTNNLVSNLEWCTRVENVAHGVCKPIVQLDSKGFILAIYKSAVEAAEQTGIARSSISLCLRGNYKHAGGFRWKYQQK